MTARHRERPTVSRPRRLAARAGSALLTVLAALGLGCIVLVVLGLTMNFSLIMFSTGSMAPTIPAGSVALVRETPASEIEVGDIVTVDREGKLPVTHRVEEILAVEGESVTFTMRGDANDAPDSEPYTAETVRVMSGHVPGVARVVSSLQSPVALGVIAIGAALLVTWAFWPRATDEPRP
ncbi:signal peptidase I [Pseudactinotalea sp.]|uniref:signal peptidase I n=1 Tax=Pseudactinotalea sp. TaxID=1926260 RepID=UPI003B3A7BE9